jgi:hypothetical protein
MGLGTGTGREDPVAGYPKVASTDSKAVRRGSTEPLERSTGAGRRPWKADRDVKADDEQQ